MPHQNRLLPYLNDSLCCPVLWTGPSNGRATLQLHDGFADAYTFVREDTINCVRRHMEHFQQQAALKGNKSVPAKPTVSRRHPWGVSSSGVVVSRMVSDTMCGTLGWMVAGLCCHAYVGACLRSLGGWPC